MTRILCRGLLLDMDGVLVDSTPAVARVWSRWALRHGLDPDWASQQAHGRTSLASIQAILPHASPAVHLEEDRWMESAEIEDVADVVALPGIHNLLSTLAPEHFAVVTSATRALAQVRLGAACLLPLIRHLVTATDIQRSKPDPEPYQKGAAALGLPPHDCIVIEDAPSGVRSGKAAGSRVIALRTTTPDEDLLGAGADWIINDCASLSLLPPTDPGELHLQLTNEDDPNLHRTPKMR
jgi:mannitol-1-/sugar-/sorbitol-6-phosphatase